jgi:hypothetical protein
MIKSFQHQKCVKANKVLLALEATPLAVCMKKIDPKTFDHLKALLNIAYSTEKTARHFLTLKDC